MEPRAQSTGCRGNSILGLGPGTAHPVAASLWAVVLRVHGAPGLWGTRDLHTLAPLTPPLRLLPVPVCSLPSHPLLLPS